MAKAIEPTGHVGSFTLTALLAFAFCVVGARAQEIVWEPIEELAGTEIAEIVIASNGDVLACTSEGLWRSRDDGDNWMDISASESNLYQVWSILELGHTLLAANGALVYRTADGGSTWARSWSGIPLLQSHDVQDFVLMHGVVYAAVSRTYEGSETRGVYRSLDEGRTWVLTSDGLTNQATSSLAVFQDRLYVGVAGLYSRARETGSLFRFDRSTSTWSVVDAFQGIVVFDIKSADEAIYVAAYDAAYWSTDAATWHEMVPDPGTRRCLAVLPLGDRILVGTEDGLLTWDIASAMWVGGPALPEDWI